MREPVKKIKFIVALLMIFILGLVTGSLGTKYMMKKKWQRFQFADPVQRIERLVDHLQRDLNLTRSQKTKVRNIITSNAVPLKELRKQSTPIFRQVHTKTMTEIRVLLDENQKVKFDQLEKRIKKHKGSHSPHRGPFGPPLDQ